MAVPYNIYLEDNILRIDFDGHIDDQELLQLEKELLNGWDDPNCIGHVYDYAKASSVSFNEAEVKRIAMLDRNESLISGELKIGIVSVDESISHYSRLYIEELRGSDWEVRLFDDLSCALDFVAN